MAKQNLQPLKGFRDFLPEDALKRKWLRDRIIEVFELWGYSPLETPTLEPLEIFEGQVGEDEKLFYKFEDNGGRKVALRYDQTVPTCRVVGQYAQELPMPFKRYQIQMAYRAENPQKGRYREFLQADADIFGLEGAYADAEIIALSLDIYRKLGFKEAKAKINSRELLKDFPYKVLASIDKLDKIGVEGVIKDLVEKGYKKDEAEQYLNDIKGLKADKSITTIFSYLNKLGFSSNWYEFDPTIIRSFSYSTGPIWEIQIPGFSGRSVLGGERFDKLIEQISGKKIPGTGFGLGFDRTLEALEELKLLPDLKTTTRTLVTIFSDKLLDSALEVVKLLRAGGINTEIYTDPTAKLEKQIKYADKKSIPWVVVIGPEEVIKKEVVLKNMKEKTQEKIPLTGLLSKISNS